MTTSKQVDELIAEIPDWRGKTFATVRKTILATNPKIVEEFKWMGTPLWSLDGMIALELTRRGRARTACALSPAGFSSPAEIRLVRGTLWFTVRLTRLLAPHADGLSGRPGQRKLLMNVFMAHPERLPRAEAAASVRAMAGAPWFNDTLWAISPWLRDPIPDPAVPVTIGWGEKDRLLFPRQGKRAIQEIPGATLVPLIDCGHLPTFDDPQQVAGLLLQTTAAASH